MTFFETSDSVCHSFSDIYGTVQEYLTAAIRERQYMYLARRMARLERALDDPIDLASYRGMESASEERMALWTTMYNIEIQSSARTGTIEIQLRPLFEDDSLLGIRIRVIEDYPGFMCGNLDSLRKRVEVSNLSFHRDEIRVKERVFQRPSSSSPSPWR